MNPCRNLANEFDSSEHNVDANWEKSHAKNDFQVESLYSFEDGIEIFDEETYIEDIKNINLPGREKNDDLHDEVIAAHEVKELTEEELNHIRPYIGKEFESQEDAYDFYNRFAGNSGFSIPRHSTNKSRLEPCEVIGRTFCCSRQGLRDPRAKPVEQRKRQRVDVRTNCKAVMMIKKRNDRWIVSHVVEEHNHKLVSPSKRHNLRSLRILSNSQKQIIANYRLAGVKTSQMINYLAVESGGVTNIGFLPKDARNYLSTRRQLELKHGDAQAVSDYFERQQMENPSFFYSIQVDSQDQMTNFFWADAKSMMDYYYFGDVVCFDPTYSTNRYDMSFVPIVGINHHYQTVLFGGALLYSESEESFAWVMKTWMRAMHGKIPKVILTDQESAIGGAIVRVLPVENIQNLPTQYVLKRWTRDAKSGAAVFDQGEEIIADSRDAVTIRYSKLCQSAINIAVKGSTSVPIYNAAVHVLQKALEDIEKLIKDSQVNAESPSGATQNENITSHENKMENLPSMRDILGDPPIVTHKGKK